MKCLCDGIVLIAKQKPSRVGSGGVAYFIIIHHNSIFAVAKTLLHQGIVTAYVAVISTPELKIAWFSLWFSLWPNVQRFDIVMF